MRNHLLLESPVVKATPVGLFWLAIGGSMLYLRFSEVMDGRRGTEPMEIIGGAFTLLGLYFLLAQKCTLVDFERREVRHTWGPFRTLLRKHSLEDFDHVRLEVHEQEVHTRGSGGKTYLIHHYAVMLKGDACTPPIKIFALHRTSYEDALARARGLAEQLGLRLEDNGPIR